MNLDFHRCFKLDKNMLIPFLSYYMKEQKENGKKRNFHGLNGIPNSAFCVSREMCINISLELYLQQRIFRIIFPSSELKYPNKPWSI